ncbi:MAG TPA: porin [Pirellulaceae bacterium]|nr:porin [Pirellulaceae bacterium]HMO91327.1 porin [Pirellulaceae bacterium]HMP70146.1 porin [Pirellulaceae bacterium]
MRCLVICLAVVAIAARPAFPLLGEGAVVVCAAGQQTQDDKIANKDEQANKIDSDQETENDRKAINERASTDDKEPKDDEEAKAEQENKQEANDKAAVTDTEKPKSKAWYEKVSLRGYAQFRHNSLTYSEFGSAPRQHAGDSSIEADQEFLIRRARLIVFGDVSDHLYVYFQPDFAATPDGATNNTHFTQIRDWYGDVYLTTDKVNRLRVGQSKVPYGWENLQSSQNRLSLDRNDAFNSATRNERDLGVFYYWTPNWAQDTFQYISDNNLKGSGNYGVFGLGVYNGQGGSLRELNDEVYVISRLTWPTHLPNGQLVEYGIQGFTGRYVVNGAAISPLGVGPATVPLGTRGLPFGEEGLLDQRLGWTFIQYPQPWGIQIEHTIGRGPELNADQTQVERGSLHGGYMMVNYRYDAGGFGEIFPFVRWQYFRGGYRSFANAPASRINEWNIGIEWQIKKDFELACEYLITDRTNLQAFSSGRSYDQFVGHLIRLQFQINF